MPLTCRPLDHLIGQINDADFCLNKILRHFDFQIFRPQAGFISVSHGAWSDRDMFVTATEANMFD